MYKLITIFFLLIHFSCAWAFGPLVSVSKKGMVVSAQHLATQVGVDVLNAGGNAIDAAVAMGYVLAVVHPCCGNIGGGGFMMIHLADGKTVALDFREKAPARLDAEALEKSTSPYAVVGIPGTVKGLNAALKQYGTRPLKSLIAPAVKLAEEGYILQVEDVKRFNLIGEEAFKQSPNVAKIFLKEGKAYKAGDRFIQKNLGKTLALIGSQGDFAFYQGKIADALVKASQMHNGFITKRDLAEYKVSFEKPLACQYRGKQLLVTPLPSTGGITLCELLKVVEGLPLKTLEPYDSLQNLNLNLEAIRYVYQDRFRYIGDPNFVQVPVQKLLSESHAERIREKIRQSMVTQEKMTKKIPAYVGLEAPDTTAYMVADGKGNIVAVTYTINGFFGAKVIAGNTGFFLNDELKDFAYGEAADFFQKQLGVNPNAPAPEKKPASSITQVMMFENQKPVLTLATPGGDTIPVQLFNTIENMVDFKKPLVEAINAPRYFYRWIEDKVYLEPELQGKKSEIEALGYTVGKGSGCTQSAGLPYCGGMVGISFNPETHTFTGVVDRRRPAGMAASWKGGE